jgi:hypothetical protein
MLCLLAVQRHSEDLPEGLAKMCALVQQPAANFAVRGQGLTEEQWGLLSGA